MESPRMLWRPDDGSKINSNLYGYMQWLKKKKRLSFDNDYDLLWKWSVTHPSVFWETIMDYFNVDREGSCSRIMQGEMPKVRWFEGITLNYAENIFRKKNPDFPAIIHGSERQEGRSVGWDELENSVGSMQSFLKRMGIGKGDTVAGYLPCIPEATVSMLATTGLGAIWSSASPDFGANAVAERFTQVRPRVLIAVGSYVYNGKRFDKTDVIRDLITRIVSLECVIVISEDIINETEKVFSWNTALSGKAVPVFEKVPFDHALWVLFSSGTTGLPKAITHSHGGILLEQLKYGAFHNNFKPGERCFWFTTTGWMMWNYIHGCLLAGATMVLYDGSPGYPDLNVLWDFASRTEIAHFGTSAAFILANMKAGIRPKERNDFTKLVSIGSTGSTLPPEGFDWVYENVKDNLWLASMSGGTDVCSAFVGGNPMWPVYAGEIQCRALGCRLEAFDDDGKPVIDRVGEMVITGPMPSMPVFFWNDNNFEKYKESYFEMYPGIWRHGDWIRITPRNGIIIYGRSDATLNRGGVRIGTSEIYRAVDKVTEVKDSLVICIEKNGGEFWMPLFVVMQPGFSLTGEIKSKINQSIKSEYSPRHIPDEILEVQDVPYTISGKKTETPVKKVLMGKDPRFVLNAGSLRNPSSMDYFIELAKTLKE